VNKKCSLILIFGVLVVTLFSNFIDLEKSFLIKGENYKVNNNMSENYSYNFKAFRNAGISTLITGLVVSANALSGMTASGIIFGVSLLFFIESTPDTGSFFYGLVAIATFYPAVINAAILLLIGLPLVIMGISFLKKANGYAKDSKVTYISPVFTMSPKDNRAVLGLSVKL